MDVIYLPETAKGRKEFERQDAYMSTCPSRREVLALIQNAFNDFGNSILYYLLSHFDITPKTDEGRRLMGAIAAAEKVEDGLASAEVSHVTTEEAQAEATAIKEGR